MTIGAANCTGLGVARSWANERGGHGATNRSTTENNRQYVLTNPLRSNLKDYAGSFQTRVPIVSNAVQISLAIQDHSADRMSAVPSVKCREFGRCPVRRTRAEFVNEAAATIVATASVDRACAVQITG